jgi:hypothetical protein
MESDSLEFLKENDQLIDISLGWSIILKWILYKEDGVGGINLFNLEYGLMTGCFSVKRNLSSRTTVIFSI